MSSKDSHLHNPHPRPQNLTHGKEISSSTTLSFTSQLSSLINANNKSLHSTPKTSRKSRPKDDLFRLPPNRNTAKRAKRDEEEDASSPHFISQQEHSTHGEGVDAKIWERSQRKMQEKARLYAAMKRGDVEDVEERYGVDFDRKWAESEKSLDRAEGGEEEDDSDDTNSEDNEEIIEYSDEFGRTRTGTRYAAAHAQRILHSSAELSSDRFTTRPLPPPSTLIRGDTIQTRAFDPDTAPMAALASKRDRSLTPPAEEHFDASREVREKGTGFFAFSADETERKREMEGLESERRETEKRRGEVRDRGEERRRRVEERRREVLGRRGKRRAEEFLEELGGELGMDGQSAAPEKGD